MFKKLLLIYMAVMVGGFILLSITLNYAFNGYFIQEKTKLLQRYADQFETIISAYPTGTLTVEIFADELHKLEGYSEGNVWIVSGDGDLVYNPQKKELSEIKSEIDFDEVARVLAGEEIVHQTQYTALKNQTFLTLITPIRLNKQVAYALYLNAGLPEIEKSISDINRYAFLSLIISTLIASLMIFYITDNIRRDIKKLGIMLKHISKGNFDFKTTENRVDELGELATGIQAMAGELKNAEEIRRKFISDLSHDFRSPLTSIKGYTKGILDGTIPPEKWEKYLNVVYDESDRLGKLANDILDLSKMQSGELPLGKVDFDMHELLLNVLDRFEGRIKEKNVEVVLRLCERPGFVDGDPALIERVVHNLMDNAVKFVNEDGVLEVLTEVKERKLLVGIRNTGTHIPEDKLHLIWNRFSKLDDSRGVERKSSGLGLAIVKEILEAHGEKIDVYSNVYLGVMFVFSMSTSLFIKKDKPEKK
jgi:signal transduction histidine kinase